jgi:hypothetical protein
MTSADALKNTQNNLMDAENCYVHYEQATKNGDDMRRYSVV